MIPNDHVIEFSFRCALLKSTFHYYLSECCVNVLFGTIVIILLIVYRIFFLFWFICSMLLYFIAAILSLSFRIDYHFDVYSH